MVKTVPLNNSGEKNKFLKNVSFVLKKSMSLTFLMMQEECLNPIQDGSFWGCSRIWGARRGWKNPLPKICRTHFTMMKLGTLMPYLMKIQKIYKYINHVTHPLSSADITIFSPEISKFCYIEKYRYRLYFNF